jgi:crotonobetainyl-CoA:carnitine CoA-transferase CaiB-like acyl-CoA transferase
MASPVPPVLAIRTGPEKRFSTPEKRKENGNPGSVTSDNGLHHTAEEGLCISFSQAGVPAGVVQDAGDLAIDPQLKARDFFIHLEHPVLGRTTSDRSPIRMSESSTEGWKAAPLLGEDNRYVYMELLGMEEQEFSSYTEKGIIA